MNDRVEWWEQYFHSTYSWIVIVLLLCNREYSDSRCSITFPSYFTNNLAKSILKFGALLVEDVLKFMGSRRNEEWNSRRSLECGKGRNEGRISLSTGCHNLMAVFSNPMKSLNTYMQNFYIFQRWWLLANLHEKLHGNRRKNSLYFFAKKNATVLMNYSEELKIIIYSN